MKDDDGDGLMDGLQYILRDGKADFWIVDARKRGASYTQASVFWRDSKYV